MTRLERHYFNRLILTRGLLERAQRALHGATNFIGAANLRNWGKKEGIGSTYANLKTVTQAIATDLLHPLPPKVYDEPAHLLDEARAILQWQHDHAHSTVISWTEMGMINERTKLLLKRMEKHASTNTPGE